ncbi:hypothetical protein LV476_01440 [Guyparkeria hydrothermalis]|uniref:hypothetical protein n=1 Tax=Guyparkeria hydrothermalis TaxID=923 RepID=UPI00202104FD|nr:hypothetical protein [Guyparkeria hydrothermalis]MCL7743614.1 hypothetical protein [Guyparkeria hydrothermalis]
MLMLEVKDVGWWYWLVTAVLLTYGVLVDPLGLFLAVGLTVINLSHFVVRADRLTAFPVQVRFFYLLLLLVALPEPMRWLFWIPMIGTWAQVLVGYCTMARLVSLFPWNRREPLTWRLVWLRFISAPVRGSVAD